MATVTVAVATMLATSVGPALVVRKAKVMSVSASGAFWVKLPADWAYVIEAGKPTKAFLLKFPDYLLTPEPP